MPMDLNERIEEAKILADLFHQERGMQVFAWRMYQLYEDYSVETAEDIAHMVRGIIIDQ